MKQQDTQTLPFMGKLVPQDPMIENPHQNCSSASIRSAKITCDNAYYTQLPKGWAKFADLSKITDYEQPTDYIAESTDYDTSYSTPVLTVGGNFYNHWY
ncbi:hypothetical protein [Phocaeicola plebeius]|uniref:hypothetical protein n=1 Tax=Phocaeicola plebeius TaxID=310297 RepID=UPI0026EE3A78|nr:hypothetical protein [Phocaeicola plebeius]